MDQRTATSQDSHSGSLPTGSQGTGFVYLGLLLRTCNWCPPHPPLLFTDQHRRGSASQARALVTVLPTGLQRRDPALAQIKGGLARSFGHFSFPKGDYSHRLFPNAERVLRSWGNYLGPVRGLGSDITELPLGSCSTAKNTSSCYSILEHPPEFSVCRRKPADGPHHRGFWAQLSFPPTAPAESHRQETNAAGNHLS